MGTDTTRVGVPRIELGSYAPEAYIIPLYDTPRAPCRARTYDLARVKGALWPTELRVPCAPY